MTRKSKTNNDSPDRNSGTPNAPLISGRSEEEYKVGPGRPPKEHQFKPGQSGNPKGARRKPPSIIPTIKELLERAFNQKVKITQGDRAQLISRLDAGMQQLSIQFAKGDRHARRDAFWIAEKLGSEFLKPKKEFTEAVAQDHQAILDAYVARRTNQKVSSASSPVLAPPELLDDDSPHEHDKK